MVGAWDVGDTTATFYNVMDLKVTNNGTTEPVEPEIPSPEPEQPKPEPEVPTEKPQKPAVVSISYPQSNEVISPNGTHLMGDIIQSEEQFDYNIMWNMNQQFDGYNSNYRVTISNLTKDQTSTEIIADNNITIKVDPETDYIITVLDEKTGKTETLRFKTTKLVDNPAPIDPEPEPEPENPGETPTEPPVDVGRSLVAGQYYAKGEKVTHNGETKTVVQNFTYYGDETWWNAPSLFA